MHYALDYKLRIIGPRGCVQAIFYDLGHSLEPNTVLEHSYCTLVTYTEKFLPV